MERVISSRMTFVMKFVYPVFGVFGMAPAIISTMRVAPVSAPIPIIALFLIFLGVMLFTFSRVKKITISDDGLSISNFRKSIRVPFTQIKSARARFLDLGLLSIHFEAPTEFGKSVVFIPQFKPFCRPMRHPTVIELQKRVQEAHAKSSIQ